MKVWRVMTDESPRWAAGFDELLIRQLIQGLLHGKETAPELRDQIAPGRQLRSGSKHALENLAVKNVDDGPLLDGRASGGLGNGMT
jgi:hypothetical protein